jgi:hypothetical protein
VYAAQRYLYEKLSESPSLINNNAVLSQFWYDVDGGTLSQLYGVEANKENAIAISVAMEQTLKDNQGDLLLLLDQLKQLMHQSTNTNESAWLLAKSQLDAEIQQLRGQIMAYDSSLSAIDSIAFDSLASLNASINEDYSFETYEKVVNDIYLRTLGNESLDITAEQLDDLAYIAAQCPLAGGKGVFLARSLAKFFSDIEYDDKAICESVGIYAKMSFEEPAEFLTISPNPANEQITLNYAVLEDSDVQVFDLFGKLVMAEMLPSVGYELVLSVDELPTGTYFVKVVHHDGTLAMVEKLIVIK